MTPTIRALRLALLAALPLLCTSCLELAVYELDRRTSLKAYTDREEVEGGTELDNHENPTAVLSPSWQRSCVAMCLASPISGNHYYRPELRVFVFSDYEKPRFSLLIDDQPAESLADVSARSWQRFALTQEQLLAFEERGIRVVAQSPLGDWTFNFNPGFLQGFLSGREKRLSWLRRSDEVFRGPPE